MYSKQTRIVTITAVILGIITFGLVNYFGPVNGLRSGGVGFAVVLMVLVELRYKKPSATLP
jgi:hypothetical protein